MKSKKSKEATVSKTIEMPLSVSLDLKDEVTYARRKGFAEMDEKTLCPLLLCEALKYRKLNRK